MKWEQNCHFSTVIISNSQIETLVSYSRSTKDMFTSTLVDLEYETSVSIWEFEMMTVLKWQFCSHFIFLHYSIHITQMKLILLMNPDTLVCLWIFIIPIGIIEVSTSRKCCFWLYFNSLHGYWSPSTWNTVVYTSWREMERCEIRAFQLPKMGKKSP